MEVNFDRYIYLLLEFLVHFLFRLCERTGIRNICLGFIIQYNCYVCSGLVSKVVSADSLVDEAVKTAEKIAQNSQLIVGIAKEAVNSGRVLFLVNVT